MFSIQADTRAVFFDLNGTLFRDKQLHQQSYKKVLCEYGVVYSDELYESRLANKVLRDVWPAVFEREMSDEELKELSSKKNQYYEELLSVSGLDEVCGARELLQNLRHGNVPAILVTSSGERSGMRVLSHLGLTDLFSVLVFGNEVSRGKPAPDIYRHALSRVDLRSSEVVAFEDSPHGVRSAHDAGIRVIGVAGDYEKEVLFDAGARECIYDFTEVTLAT